MTVTESTDMVKVSLVELHKLYLKSLHDGALFIFDAKMLPAKTSTTTKTNF